MLLFKNIFRRMKRIIYKTRNKKLLWLLIVSIFFTFLTIKILLIPWKAHQYANKGLRSFCFENVGNNLKTYFEDGSVGLVQNAFDSDHFTPYVPFLGNGFLGAVANGNSFIYLKADKTLSFPTFVYPFAEIILQEVITEDLYAISVIDGIVHHLSCYDEALVHQYFLAHRLQLNILIQKIKIINLSHKHLEFILKKKKSDLQNIKLNETSFIVGKENWNFNIISGIVTENNNQLAISLICRNLPNKIMVHPNNEYVFWLVCSVGTASFINSKNISDLLDAAFHQAHSSLVKALTVSLNSLVKQHTDIWKKTWESGFSISRSFAHDALSGEQINITLYYILSQVIASPNVIQSPSQKSIDFQRFSSIHCYDGHHTLQAKKLWPELNSLKSIFQMTKFWHLTLFKKGCEQLLSFGANELMQAMLLSFGSLKFTKQHLEFNMLPKDLHRDMTFRNIHYSCTANITINVRVRKDNKAEISVSLVSSNETYYGCDAGCLDSPQVLGSNAVFFPVKLTEPFTPILYITPYSKHLEELKHTLHIRLVIEAPPHEHNLLALHRHGHLLGGLPLIFWVSLVFLITVFHLFLLKIIYTEYKKEYHLIR